MIPIELSSILARHCEEILWLSIYTFSFGYQFRHSLLVINLHMQNLYASTIVR